MKRMVFLGGIVLLLLTGGVLLVIHYQHDTASQPGTRNNSALKTEGNDMDAITASLSATDREHFLASLSATDREHFQMMQNDIRDAKADGDEEWAAELEKDLKKDIQGILNPPQRPDVGDYHGRVSYYEEKIKIAKEEGESKEEIARLEKWRDLHLKSIADAEVRERERQKDSARFEALSTPEEKIAYYEEQLLEDEEALRLAKEKGDPVDIRLKGLFVEGTKQAIDTQKRELAWIPVQKELHALYKEVEESEPKWIAKYRPYLHVEVVDGKEEIVGVRSHKEIEQIVRDRMRQDGNLDTIPSVPTTPDPSKGSQLPESQPSSDEIAPIPATPDRSMDGIIKAQTQFRFWRNDIDQDYVDVLVSRYMSPEELDRHFPTAEARANLTRRTTEMQKLVVSQVHDLVKDIPDAKQKREITRELVTANFDKDFADNVLKALENDAE